MKSLLLRSVAVAAFAATLAAPVSAATIYESIPDLGAAPISNGWCSDCGGSFRVFSQFTLAGAASIESITFNVMSNYNFPSTINVSIWSQSGNLPDAQLFGSDFAPASFVFTTAYLFDVSSVTINTSGWALSAGTYDISFFNPAGLGVPIYSSPDGRFYQSGLGGIGANPTFAAGFRLSDTAVTAGVPEPATWAMMLVGFAGLGFAARRRAAEAA